MGEIIGAYLMPHPPIIVPDIGKGRELEISDTIDAMNHIAGDIAEKKPDIIILISPHGALFRDAVAIMGIPELKGSLEEFGAKQVQIEKKNDLEFAKEIDAAAWGEGIPAVFLDSDKIKDYKISRKLDHGAVIPLYFIEKAYRDYRLIHVNYGLLSKIELYTFGEIIASCVEKTHKKAVIIASGDLSHKLTQDAPAGYNKNGAIFDKTLLDFLEKGDVSGVFSIDDTLTKEAGECGLRSVEMMLGAFEGNKISVKTLSYEGPFGVGYGTAVIKPEGKSRERIFKRKIIEIIDGKVNILRDKESEYVKLARSALENYVSSRKKINVPSDISPDLKSKKAGVFVSLKKDGELRGCIGTIEAVENSIAEEIIRNAIQAGTQDPRFYPVEKNELDKLIYSVDILGEPEHVENISILDPKKYGVIVESGFRKGLLLPNLEGVSTVEEQIDIALNKANIRRDEEYTISRFKVERYK